MRKGKIYILLFVVYILGCTDLKMVDDSQEHFGRFQNVSEAGLDTQKIEKLKARFRTNGGDVLLVVREGKIVLSLGDVTRSFRQASIRKSYLHALFGVLMQEGKLNVNQTLSELGIDDIHKLTEVEKQATIENLLTSRSGIYLPAAYSPRSMIERMPKRGSAAPNEKWFYNNWDFNALGTIYQNISGRDIVESFEKYIAIPLAFEDFGLEKSKLLYEKDKSDHPAYLFRMSARDMARFGQLYLNKGHYNGAQIIPENWITESFKIHSYNQNSSDGLVWDDYGKLWWISNQITKEPVVYAAGTGTQRIVLFPESDMLMIHLVDTYQPKQVGDQVVDELVKLLLDAKVQQVTRDAATVEFSPTKITSDNIDVGIDKLNSYSGKYSNPRMGTINIVVKQDKLWALTNIGDYLLRSIGTDTFINEDMQIPFVFSMDSENDKGAFQVKMNDNGKIEGLIFLY